MGNHSEQHRSQIESDCKAPGHEGNGCAAPGRTRSTATEQPGLHPRGGPPKSPLHLASPQHATSQHCELGEEKSRRHQPVGRERERKATRPNGEMPAGTNEPKKQTGQTGQKDGKIGYRTQLKFGIWHRTLKKTAFAGSHRKNVAISCRTPHPYYTRF